MSSAEIEIRDITRWAGEKESHDGLPELVHRLLRETPGVTRIDLPTGDSSRYRGWDGLVTATAGSVWLPEGRSCWEIGCDADAKKKADSDYGNRIRDTKGIDPATATYICVTPRQWAGGRAWAEKKTKAGPWKEVRVLDAGELLQWLADCRRAALWFRVTVLKDKDAGREWNDVTIGWDPDALRYEAGPLRWLTWRARLTEELFGRDEERADLLRWARAGGGVRFRLLVGEGGSGKTRLAHEVADELARDSTWAAGQVTHTDRPLPLDAGQDGCLLLIDYPEEKREQIRERLAELAAYRANGRTVRVLLLTRQGEEYWQSLIDDTGVGAKWTTPLYLREGVASDDAYRLYSAALARVPVEGARPDPVPISAEAFQDWLRRAPVNQRPLLIAAAAVQAVHEPARSVTSLTGPEVIQALARREASRLRRLGKRHGLGEDALVRLSALAAVRGGLDEQDIVRLAAPDLDLGLKEVAGLIDRLAGAGLLTGNCLRAPEPDIVAAALLSDVLAARSAKAPAWLRAVIAGAEAEALDRLGRLSHDADVMLGLRQEPLSMVIAEVAGDNVTLCYTLEPVLRDAKLPQGLLPLAIRVWRTLLTRTMENSERAELLTSLGVHLMNYGVSKEALDVSREAVEIYRRLTAGEAAGYEPELGGSLNNLSIRLFAVGDNTGALAASWEAVEIYRRLSAVNASRHVPALAMSLNNLSNWLSAVGDNAGGLAAIREAVEIYRGLSAANASRYEPTFAGSLNNLSIRLSTVGDNAGALAAIREAVEINRRLSVVNASRYEPTLAGSLNNLSSELSVAGDNAGALAAIREAVEINRRLSAVNVSRYEPALAMSLNNLSSELSAAGDKDGALLAIREAVEIYHHLNAVNMSRYEPDFATSLNNLSARLSAAGDNIGALAAIQEAVEINRRLSAMNASRYEAELAMSLNNLSSELFVVGDNAGALAAIREAVDIRRRLDAGSAAPFGWRIANSLWALAMCHDNNRDTLAAITALEEAIPLIEPSACAYPKSDLARRHRGMCDMLARLKGGGEAGSA